MKQIVSFALIVAIALGWTISTNSTCSCNQLLQSFECESSGCLWNTSTNKCIDYICSQLSMYSCMSAKNCYFNTTQCVSFTTCASVPSDNPQACYYAGCQYNNGACQEYSCTNFNSTTCPSFCQLNGQNCQNPTTCSQYSPQDCQYGNACQLVDGMCIPATCNSLSPSNCQFVQTSLSLQSVTIQPCYLDSNYTCQDAEPYNLNTTQSCFYNTLGLYHWSTSDSSLGRCIACQQPQKQTSLSYGGILVGVIVLAIF